MRSHTYIVTNLRRACGLLKLIISFLLYPLLWLIKKIKKIHALTCTKSVLTWICTMFPYLNFEKVPCLTTISVSQNYSWKPIHALDKIRLRLLGCSHLFSILPKAKFSCCFIAFKGMVNVVELLWTYFISLLL